MQIHTIELLGTGTSDGIPRLGCSCPVCTSKNPADKRLRTSALIRISGNPERTIIIDTGLDFRQQALKTGLSNLDAILFTHSHADHVEGITELRPLSLAKKQVIPCFGTENTLNAIRQRFSYIFKNRLEGGGLPLISLHKVSKKITLFDKEIILLPIKHGSEMITGFRFGELAYITDASKIPEETRPLLHGVRTLIINGLRYKPHSTHFSIDEAVEEAGKIGAKTTRLVHLSHKVLHKDLQEKLPKGINPGVDGEKLTFLW